MTPMNGRSTAWVPGSGMNPWRSSCGFIGQTCLVNTFGARSARLMGNGSARKNAARMVSASTESNSIPAMNEWDGRGMEAEPLIKQIKWNKDGLVPAIAQQHDTGEVLMMAWMNEESVRETLKQGRVVYYSRSRQQLWRKGDTSGQVQFLKDLILDCDGDTLLLMVDQIGVACHTGRRSCFYFAFRPEDKGQPKVILDVLMDPKKMYK